MAIFRSSVLLALFGLAIVSQVSAQGSTLGTLDFWLKFGEEITANGVDALSKFQLPSIQFPTITWPNIPWPNIQLPGWPSPPPAPAPGADLSQAQHEYLAALAFINAMQGKSGSEGFFWPPVAPSPVPATAAPSPPKPTTPKPCTTAPTCDNCKPEQVKIIVVDDCDEKSSSSSEESREIQVIQVPRRGRYNYQKNDHKCTSKCASKCEKKCNH